MVISSPGPTPWELKEILLLVDSAAAVRVKWVLSVIDATVPMIAFPVVLMILPMLISVVKRVFVPVMIAESVLVVTVPVLLVFGQALALQFPEVTLEMEAASVVDKRNMIKNDAKTAQ